MIPRPYILHTEHPQFEFGEPSALVGWSASTGIDRYPSFALYDRSFLCMEATYPYALCLELVHYGIRELA